MKKHSFCLWLFIICLFLNTQTHANNTINSATITQATLKAVPHCMHYKVTGTCFWLRCTNWGCNTETTLKLDQYLPDVVISSYTKPTNNPWQFAQKIEDPLFAKAGKMQLKQLTGFNMGFGDERNHSRRDLNNKFHEVDIIGNPALSALSLGRAMLPSTAIPFTPYYSSLLDAYAWRYPALERFYLGSVIPGIHEVGLLLLHDWGPVYPRNGYVNQPDLAKAAAVTALRAATIVTELGQPHLYAPLLNNCGQHCSVYPVKENSQNAQFQMIYPKASSQCSVFGSSDFTQLKPWGADLAIQDHDRYVWVLWRHYHGCVPDRGAKFISST